MQSVLKETIIYKAGETDMIRFLLAKGYEYPNESDQKTTPNNDLVTPPGRGGYSHTLPIRVCAAQRDRDFEASDLDLI